MTRFHAGQHVTWNAEPFDDDDPPVGAACVITEPEANHFTRSALVGVRFSDGSFGLAHEDELEAA